MDEKAVECEITIGPFKTEKEAERTMVNLYKELRMEESIFHIKPILSGEEIKIKGRIFQVIPPDKQNKYECQEDFDFIDGKYLVCLQSLNAPQSRLKWFIFRKITHRKTWENFVTYVATDNYPGKRGSIVTYDVEQYMKPTSLYVEK